MSFEKDFTPSNHPDYVKMRKEADKVTKIKVSVIFKQSTHRMIKAIAATQGDTISDIMEDLAQQYLKERGKL